MPSPSSLTAVELELKAGSSLGRSLAKELAADAGGHNLQLASRQANVLAAAVAIGPRQEPTHPPWTTDFS